MDNQGLVQIVHKGKTKKANWWEVYSFSNHEEFEEWEKKVKEIIKNEFKLSDEETQREFELFDMWHGIPQNYLFKKQGGLF